MRCEAITRAGTRCKARATEGSSWCYNHDPARAAERSRNARAGGKAGGNGRPSPGRNLELIDKTLSAIIGGLLRLGKNPLPVNRRDAAVAVQALGQRIRLAEVERRMLEYEDLERRVAELEEQLMQEVNRWAG
jgi:hypothetical protein